ncbi:MULTISPECIES: DsbA family protein [Streptomyces]|jgi:predicted DsbA family dithiol-disulfide isomerase|uniref:Protein disulfide isomerase FrnE n=1 Tax=Streptomyces longisporus TaxID=1948 RepID=A0ABP6AI37_STRLO
MSDVVKIDVWSDIACPWCYIGKRRLEQAIARFDGRVEIEYHSFELAPDTPADYPGTQADFLAEYKHIPVEQAQQMLNQVTDVAAGEGLAFDYDALRPANTVLAHQALRLAKAHDLQGELKERLLSAYFEQGRNLNDPEVIAGLAAEVGLDRDEVLAALREETYLPEVHADQAQAAAYGITGVPFYVLDGRLAVSGAQSPELFLSALERATSMSGRPA